MQNNLHMNTRYTGLFNILVAIAAILLLNSCAYQEKPLDHAVVNESIVYSKHFYVNSDSTDLKTSAEGTVFVKGDNEKYEHIQIVSSIEIDPDDWGGVAFYIPENWYVSNIISSYPEDGTLIEQEENVSTWTTASSEKVWRGWVEVGRDRGYNSSKGGTGTIVIELMPDQHVDPIESNHISIEVGSAVKNGHKIMGTDYIDIPLSLREAK